MSSEDEGKKGFQDVFRTSSPVQMFAGKQHSENWKTAPSTDISDQETTTKKPTGSFKQFSENFQKGTSQKDKWQGDFY